MSASNANEKETSRPTKKRGSETIETENRGSSREVFAADHDPPIGTGGCSFFLEFPVDAVVIPDAASGSSSHGGAIYATYPFSEKLSSGAMGPKNYTGLAELRVVTEKLNGQVEINVHDFRSQNAALVKLWLTDSATDPPDIIIQCDGNGAALARKNLKKSESNKKSRVRYYHKSDDPSDLGNSDRPEVRLHKWQVVSGGISPTVLKEASGDDSYYLYMYFTHP
jgi:hypothetical protein